MSKSLKNTKTLENLMKAFAGESQARNRYTYYAAQARKEGLRQIEAVFLETADHEREHAKRFFKAVTDNITENIMVPIEAEYPAGLGDTAANLAAAAAGEHEEYTDLYPKFTDVAEAEGFPAVAHLFRMICVAEKYHESRYKKLLENLEAGKVFKKNGRIMWKCRNCGYIHEADEAPGLCPACAHKQEHFEVLAENY